MNTNIKHLKPAAARLLLAILASQGCGSFDDVVVLSGIGTCQKLTAAKEELRTLGFIVQWNGDEHVTLTGEADE